MPGDGVPRPWRRDAGFLALTGTVLVLWLVFTLPLATGERTLHFRDVFQTHLPLKAFGAAQLAAGEVPAFNPQLGMGQPFRGNPSALAFYPGNLLYLALPLWSAFNLHFALHWLLALVAMAVLARELGQGRLAALAAGLTYAGSGYVVSCLTFYNLVTVAAWWPLAMAGAVRGGRRGIALGGLACGMALLGGEPMTAALGLLPLVIAAVGRHGGVRGLVTAVAVGGVGLAVAAPQVVATARILGFSFRGYHGATTWQAALFSLPPARLAELVLPLPFGWPLDLGPGGWWAWAMAPNLVYFLSLYAGVVGLWLAAGAARRHPVWAVVASGGLLLAWLAGAVATGALLTLSGGLFRFPEKLLFWYALALPPLVGWGLEAALARPRRWVAAAWTAGGALFAAALVLLALRPSLVGAFSGAAAVGPLAIPEVVALQSWRWIGYLAAGGALLGAAGWAAARGRPAVVVALQLVALLQLLPLTRTMPVATVLGPTPFAPLVAPGTAVLHTLEPRPVWEPEPSYRFPPGGRDLVTVRNARDLDAVPGLFRGLTYPLWPDAEGLSSPLYTFLTVELSRASWSERASWLRATGVDALVTHRPPRVAGLVPIARAETFGAPSLLYRVEGSAPGAWWPERVEAAPGPAAAFARVGALADPVATVVAAEAVDHRPGGRVRIVSEEADRVVLDVAGPGGLAVLRRAYHPVYRARAGDRPLATQPANLTLTGIEVPPGEHRVVIAVDGTPEALAATFAALAVAAALAAGLWRRRGPWGGAYRPGEAAMPAATGAAAGPAAGPAGGSSSA